ncbi:MAG: peptidylprolyl isomerase [Longimicrobiales bacterium]
MNNPISIPGLRALRPVVILAAALPLSSCFAEPPALAIGDVEYTDSELLTLNATRRTRLAELTAFGLAVARGETNQLGAPLIQRRGREALLEKLERELALRFAGVDEETLEARYRANPEYELTVRHLVVLAEEWASEEEVGEARSKADAARERILGGEPFPQVAGEVSEEPGAAERGGLLQPGRRGTWVDEFWETASALDVGDVSSVIRTPYGFHVLKLEERQPVPFPEGRDRVVVEVARLVTPQDSAIQAWVDSVTTAVTVDTAAIGGAFEEAGSLFGLTRHALLREGSSATVAQWPGGSYSGSQLRTFLLSLERPEWEYVGQGGRPEVLRIATDAARRTFLGEVARSQGVTLRPEKEASLHRDWENSVAGWAQGLGFRENMRLDALKAAAFRGVTSSGQGARIARDELHGWGPMLLTFYPIGPDDS